MENKTHRIGFVGLGFAGFPMACLFSKKFDIVGYDLSQRRIAELRSGIDHCGDVDDADIQAMLDKGTLLTTNIDDLKDCDIFIVTVPTPVDAALQPDLSYLTLACREIGSILKKGDIVVFASTVYPGATEEVCVPILEEVSGLRYNEDFFVGYAPERINPGDREHTVENTVKITAGSTPVAAKEVHKIYADVLGPELTYPVSSIKVAEACKIVENTQRDINVAFINEVSMLLRALNVDTNEVIDAMNTKWNALGFRPGLVGGHCIGVDPYYLTVKAKDVGVPTPIMSTSRNTNNAMAPYVVDKIYSSLKRRLGDKVSKAKVLILGFTFKENVPDIRNTKILDIYKDLKKFIPNVTIFDPVADSEMVKNIYRLKISTSLSQISRHKYDAIVLCVAHDILRSFDLESHLTANGFVYDLKGFFDRSAHPSVNIERI